MGPGFTLPPAKVEMNRKTLMFLAVAQMFIVLVDCFQKQDSKQNMLNKITKTLVEKGVKCLVHFGNSGGDSLHLEIPAVNIQIDKIGPSRFSISPSCSWHIIDLDSLENIFKFLDQFHESLPKSDHYFFIIKSGRTLQNQPPLNLFSHNFFKKVILLLY